VRSGRKLAFVSCLAVATVLFIGLLVAVGLRAMPAAAAVSSPPAVSVSPAIGLRDSETVSVSLRGFSRGVKVWVSECARRREVGADGCGEELAAQPFVVTDSRGRASLRFVIRERAATTAAGRPGSPVYVHCTACVLVATEGGNLDHHGETPTLAETSLTFQGDVLPFTGLPTERLALLGLVAIGIGGFLIFVGRQRRGEPSGRAARE
jgi:hypothetical protein